jgi:hypothetical protein
MHRRRFLQVAAAASLGSGAVSRLGELAAAEPLVGKAPFRLWYNNDTTNIMGVDSPFHKRGEPLTDEAIFGSIDEVADKGVDAYALSPGLGHVPFWKSQVYPDHFQWWMKKTGLEPDAYGRYLLDGGDMVRALVERCRHHGMAPFVSLRMNDVHLLENVGQKTPKSIWVSRFYEENPELLLDPDHPRRRPKGYDHWRGQNWAKEEVRRRKLDYLTELCENYDLAGVELDWLRDQHIFPRELPLAEKRKILAEFQGQVRAMLDRTAPPGQRRYLSVRVPLALSGHDEFGFDVQAAITAGVDILNCSGWFQSQPMTDLAKIRRLAPAATIFQELTHAAGSLRLLKDPRTDGYGTAPFPRTSDEMLVTAANLAYHRGADGISLFNFVYYRMGGGHLAWLVREPPFHVLPKLLERDWLSRQPQFYWSGPWPYLRQVRHPIEAGSSGNYRIDIALPNRTLGPHARLRVVCKNPLGDATLVASMNGTRIEPTQDIGPPFDYPYDRLLGENEHRRAWDCPSGLLREGINVVRITLERASGSVMPLWLDLAVS